jgi:hypothetical protein
VTFLGTSLEKLCSGLPGSRRQEAYLRGRILCRTRILAAVRVQCCAMNHLKLSLIMVSLSVGLSAARADSVPVEGTRELRINSGVTLLPSYGSGLSVIAPENGNDETVVSMGGGLGYFLTQHVEVGGAVG